MELHADYLNPESHDEQGIPNLVTSSLQTTRRFDVLKLWLSFRLLGREKLGAMIDRTIQLASFAAGIVSRDASLELVHGGSLSTVVFRYVPERKGIDEDEVNAAIRQRLFDRGSAVIGHTRVRGRQCLKFTFMNPSVSEEQIEELVGMVTKCGRQMEKELS